MNDKNYKFVIPVSSSECLEVYPKTIQGIDSEGTENSSDLKIFAYENGSQNSFTEVPKSQQLQHEIMRILKVTHQGLSRYFERHETYIVPSANGFQLIRSNQILYFEYSKAKKHWVAVLINLSCIILKSSTTALTILEYSNSYIRINQHCIINLNYLTRIDLNVCVLTIQTNSAANLNVTRSYLKDLQETMRVI